MRSTPVFNDFYKPPDLGKWFVIMLLGRNSVTLFSNEYTGLTLCKVRQLKKLGYEPIMVRIFLFYALIIYQIDLLRLVSHLKN